MLSQLSRIAAVTIIAALSSIIGRAAEPTKAYGILAFSYDQYSITNHLVSFDLEGDEPAVYTSYIGFAETSTAGAYASDGKYYLASTKLNGTTEIPNNLVCMDLNTKSTTTVGKLSGLDYKLNDMTYDHSSSTMYAIARINESFSALYTINLTSGKATKVADLDRKFFTLAANYAGQLYAISFSGEFCKINKSTGEVSVVGHTGYYPEKFQSMEFDHQTRMLWWAATTHRVNESGTIELQETYMMTIDPATGAATRGRSLGDDQIAGLYIPYTVVADGAPMAVENLSVIPGARGKYSATINWINPMQNFAGEPLKSLSNVTVERDGNVVGTITSAQLGKASSFVDDIAASGGAKHQWTVTAHTAAGAGLTSSIEAFVGADIPAAVENITIDRLGNNSVRLNWNPVVGGANDGWIDMSTLTYSIVRQPDNVQVANNLTETEWVEPGVEVSNSYTYEITATNSAGSSAPAVSPAIALGPELGFPYFNSLTKKDFEKWTVVDANEDRNTWIYSSLSWANAAGAYFMASSKPGDDWFISPAFNFEGNSSYKMTLNSIPAGNHTIEVYLLKEFDYAKPAESLGTINLERSSALANTDFIFTVGDAGSYNLALLEKTPAGNSYLLINSIQIEQLVDNNLAATSISGNPKPVVDKTYPYGITVENRGRNPKNDFVVELLDDNGSVVGATTVNETLASGASMLVYVQFAAKEGVTSLRGHVNDPADEIAADNTTAPLPITIMPMGTPEEVTVGAAKGWGSYSPFYFNEKYSANQQVYAANEIGIAQGRITAISYDYKTSAYSTPPTNAEIKVYLANTELATAADGWIPMEELTLVYDGAVNMAQGEGVLELPLSKAFDYAGGNLAIVTMLSLENASASYYSNVQFPYYDSPLSGNTPLYYKSYTPFTYGSVKGQTSAYYGNPVVTLSMQTGGATLSGTVVDADGNPVEAATVSVEPLHATARTDAFGAYVFNYLPNGSYTVTATAFGYEESEEYSVTVNDEDVVNNLSLTKIPAYAVFGKVHTPEGTPAEGVTVTLNGYTTLATLTDAAGTFRFDEVVSSPSKVVAVADWYAPVAAEFDFEANADVDLGTLAQKYARYPVGNVTATVSDGAVELSWSAPDAKSLLRNDSDNVVSQIGISNDVGTAIIGTAFRTPMLLDRVMWQTTNEGGSHYSLSLYVYDLDSEGNPTGTLLYSKRNIDNADGQWAEHVLDAPVAAPHGCLVALNYPGFLSLGIDSGSKEYPFCRDDYYFSLDFTNPDFGKMSDLGLDGNLLLRAEGYAFPAENDPQAAVGDARSALPEWYAYNIWRGIGVNPEEWALLNDAPLSSTSFTDPAWDDLDAGVYRYAVAPVYPDGTSSEKTLSCCVLNSIYSTLIIKAATNSHSKNAAGAEVALHNTDGSQSYSAIIGTNGSATITDVWKDTYILELSLPGYQKLTASINAAEGNEIVTEPFGLKEIIATPVNLKVYRDADGLKFTWNESGEIFDDFENYEPFTIPGSDDMPWLTIDGDGGRTFAEADFIFPGMTDPMSFVVFNPKETTPAMYDQRSASHALSGDQFLACFSSVYGNDDYLISPRLTYHTPFTFAFHAKGISQTYGETIQIGYSTTSDLPEAFTWITGDVSVPMQVWTEYEYEMPAEARYVAIKSTSTDGFTLCIDDVKISSGNGFAANTALSGSEVAYEVLLDGQKLADVSAEAYPLGELSGNHILGVKAVYASGASVEATLEIAEDSIGEVEIIGSEVPETYDLQGRRVVKPRRGFYITNGKITWTDRR